MATLRTVVSPPPLPGGRFPTLERPASGVADDAATAAVITTVTATAAPELRELCVAPGGLSWLSMTSGVANQ